MTNSWVRYKLTAELLSDTHPGSGSGGDGVDSLIARDRYGRPVIWASHVEGVLRDAARRLKGNAAAEVFLRLCWWTAAACCIYLSLHAGRS